ncbi:MULTISPECIES: serine O-acetyltransferase [Methylomonas]|uniref:serine O-acetyltransferase n=1 Tax=Methylomonas TaxID=416 RepID=UPI00123260E5|nr:hypothetical protein [Methylomonas rhizoryzae]
MATINQTYSDFKADLKRLNDTAPVPVKLTFFRALRLISRQELCCLLLYRISHLCYCRGNKCLAGFLYRTNLLLTAADIHPRSKIGPGCLIAHAIGLVVDAQIGRNCTLLGHNVVGPAYSNGQWSSTPTIGDDVTICLKALVLGDIELKDQLTIGPYSLIDHSLTISNCVVSCVPTKIVTAPQATPANPIE